MRDAPCLDFAGTFLVSRLQPAPGHKVGIHLRLTFVLVALCEVNLFAQLADDIYVSVGDDTGKCGDNHVFSNPVHDV